MKLSVSLSEDDVALVDEYAAAAGLRSRSAVVQHALRLLRQRELEQDYEAAWDEWAGSEDAVAWETAAADGLVDAAR